MAGKRKYDHDEIWRLYNEGYSDRQICEAIGCSQEYIRNLREKERLPQNVEPFDTGKMNALHRAGWSPYKIADKMGVDVQEIKERLNGTFKEINRNISS